MWVWNFIFGVIQLRIDTVGMWVWNFESRFIQLNCGYGISHMDSHNWKVGLEFQIWIQTYEI